MVSVPCLAVATAFSWLGLCMLVRLLAISDCAAAVSLLRSCSCLRCCSVLANAAIYCFEAAGVWSCYNCSLSAVCWLLGVVHSTPDTGYCAAFWLGVHREFFAVLPLVALGMLPSQGLLGDIVAAR